MPRKKRYTPSTPPEKSGLYSELVKKLEKEGLIVKADFSDSNVRRFLGALADIKDHAEKALEKIRELDEIEDDKDVSLETIQELISYEIQMIAQMSGRLGKGL